jgi:hypothetical protein
VVRRDPLAPKRELDNALAHTLRRFSVSWKKVKIHNEVYRVNFTVEQIMKACMGKYTYSCTSSLNLVMGKVGWPKPRPSLFKPQKETLTNFIGGCLGSKARLERRRKSHPYPDSIPGTSNP